MSTTKSTTATKSTTDAADDAKAAKKAAKAQRKADAKAAAKTDPLRDRRAPNGGLIDPPTIPEYETRLAAAHAAADDELIREVTDEYHKAREGAALAEHKRDKARRKRARENNE